MGRTPCCNKKGLKRGPWTPEEDDILTSYINKNGHGTWRSLPKLVGLLRCGKSCRLRWTNYLRPDIKRGGFTVEEEKLVIQLHGILGNRWAAIASQLQGRTDNDIKNLWNTHLKKRLGLDPKTRQPLTPSTRHMAQWESARLQAESRLSRESSLVYPPAPAPASTSTTTTADHFLRIWNSDVGESFRTFYHPSAQTSPAAASASDQASVSAVTTAADHISPSLAACSAATPSSNQNEDDQYMECKSCKSYNTTHEDHFIAAQLSSSSSVQSDDDSSDSTLQFLLDFPINNDISFLQEGNNMDNN